MVLNLNLLIEIIGIYYWEIKSEHLLIVVWVRFSNILYGFILAERFMKE